MRWDSLKPSCWVIFKEVLLHMLLFYMLCQVSLSIEHFWAWWTLVIQYITSPFIKVWNMNQLLMSCHILYSDMLTACLAYAFGAVLYSCDMAKDSIFTKILCCRMMFFLVLHKSRKVVIGYIARGLVALNTFFVCNNQVIIQRRYICVALVTFSTIQSPLVKVHCFFMEFAMGWIKEYLVTKCARSFLIPGLVFLTQLLLFTFVTCHTQLLLFFPTILFTTNDFLHFVVFGPYCSVVCCGQKKFIQANKLCTLPHNIMLCVIARSWNSRLCYLLPRTMLHTIMSAQCRWTFSIATQEMELFHKFDQISQFWPNFTILTKFHNFDQVSQFWPSFTILV